MILKVAVAVITTIAGVLGVNAMKLVVAGNGYAIIAYSLRPFLFI